MSAARSREERIAEASLHHTFPEDRRRRAAQSFEIDVLHGKASSRKNNLRHLNETRAKLGLAPFEVPA